MEQAVNAGREVRRVAAEKCGMDATIDSRLRSLGSEELRIEQELANRRAAKDPSGCSMRTVPCTKAW